MAKVLAVRTYYYCLNDGSGDDGSIEEAIWVDDEKELKELAIDRAKFYLVSGELSPEEAKEKIKTIP